MDYTELQETYGGKHIARRGDEVLEATETLEQLLRILEAKDLISQDIVVEFVRPKGVIYAL